MVNFEVGQIVKVVDKDIASTLAFYEYLFGNTKTVDCFGVVKEVSPKDLRVYQEFAGVPEYEATTGLEDALVYYDEGAQRHFVVDTKHLRVVE